MGSQERAPLYAPAVLIAGRQGKLGVPLPLPGGFLVPLGGLNEVPRHAGAVFVAASQIILRMLVAQLGGLAVPEHGLGCVLSHAFASFAANAQHILCLGVALLGGPAEPANGLGLVLLCAPAVIAEAQLILRLCIAQLRSQELRLQQELSDLEAKGMPQLTMDNIARVIEMWTKIPASKIKEEEFQRLSQLETRLKKHIVGQDEAVAAVAAAIRRNRVGISPKHKPVSFIFVGSTGVGKTELVKQLADDLFNAPESLIRLDMSEFMEKHSVSRIVGSPPGYVGYDEAGQLTEKIRRKPYSVVLFDEIEKAHPDVLNVLLQILDDGQITDAHGRKVNFENTVIVMTSNAGSDKAAGSVGFDKSAGDQGKERVMKALRDFLRPEFINRVDEVIYFHQLTEENFRDIARIMLDELKTSLSDKGFGFMYDDGVVDVLVKKSYSAAYGARNLRRCIQKELEDPMANLIIDAFEHPITQLKATAEDGQIKLYSL